MPNMFNPYLRANASVTAPLYCACTHNPLGAYASKPFCHGVQQPHPVQRQSTPVLTTLRSPTQTIERAATLRSPTQVAAFGPEIYQGHYGIAYKLRFPSYGGPAYQYEQCKQADGTFAPCARKYYPTMHHFNSGAGYVNPSAARYVVLGSRTSPYFHVFDAPVIGQ